MKGSASSRKLYLRNFLSLTRTKSQLHSALQSSLIGKVAQDFGEDFFNFIHDTKMKNSKISYSSQWLQQLSENEIGLKITGENVHIFLNFNPIVRAREKVSSNFQLHVIRKTQIYPPSLPLKTLLKYNFFTPLDNSSLLLFGYNDVETFLNNRVLCV